MALLPGFSGLKNTPTYDASGTITTGGTAQRILPFQPTRSYLLVQNTSSANLYLGIGGATATATISSGVVNSISVANGGLGYTYPPIVQFFGGGTVNAQLGDALGSQWGNAPAVPAQAKANLTSNAVSSITILNGGSGYLVAPFVYLQPDPRDPYGAFAPSATAGIVLQPGLGYVAESSVVTNDPISIFGATAGQSFVCKFIV